MRKCDKQDDIPSAVALIQLETIIPTVGMNFVGFQNGLSFNPILVPAIEMAMVLTPTETKTERNFIERI
jgi:hypothetical protein